MRKPKFQLYNALCINYGHVAIDFSFGKLRAQNSNAHIKVEVWGFSIANIAVALPDYKKLTTVAGSYWWAPALALSYT